MREMTFTVDGWEPVVRMCRHVHSGKVANPVARNAPECSDMYDWICMKCVMRIQGGQVIEMYDVTSTEARKILEKTNAKT